MTPSYSPVRNPFDQQHFVPLSTRSVVTALIFLVGLFSLWRGFEVYKQHSTITAIEQLGGNVGNLRHKPAWLRKWLGAHWITALYGITYIDLSGTDVQDKDVLYVLQAVPELERLYLNKTNISDAGIAQLNRNKQIHLLNLSETHITNIGLVQLRGLTHLTYLHLGATRITDAGLLHLNNSTNLTYLDLSQTGIDGSGFQHIGHNIDLKDLVAYGTRVDDAALEHLAMLPALEELQLDETRVTDGGLACLRGLTAMRTVCLANTTVTDAGIAELRNALPKIRIIK
jgi:hypothetical protein